MRRNSTNKRRPRRSSASEYIKRDSRRNRFPLPNDIWSLKLRPAEFVILSYLHYRYCHPNEQCMSATPECIAEAVCLSVKTVNAHLTKLVRCELVNSGDAFIVAVPTDISGNYFTLPNEVFSLKLPPAALMVYAYLLYCEDRKTHRCHPSYRTIASGTGLSSKTVVKHITTLVDNQLIKVEGTSYLDRDFKKWTGNNLYTIRPMSSVLDEETHRKMRYMELTAEQRRSELFRRQRPRDTADAMRVATGNAAKHDPLPF